MNENQFRTPAMVEIELTSKCTLKCEVCARTLDPDENWAKWKFGQIDIKAVEKILQQPSVVTMNYTGAYGDPIYHTKFIDIIKLTKQYGKKMHITTNGSYRTASWWESVADVLTIEDSFQFSVDGLPHNNHLYRINSDWPSIEVGMRILGKSKVFTEWKWILFNYNENDVIEGYKLSRELGIKSFSVIGTQRWPNGLKAIRPYNEVVEELKNYIESHKHEN